MTVLRLLAVWRVHTRIACVNTTAFRCVNGMFAYDKAWSWVEWYQVVGTQVRSNNKCFFRLLFVQSSFTGCTGKQTNYCYYIGARWNHSSFAFKWKRLIFPGIMSVSKSHANDWGAGIATAVKLRWRKTLWISAWNYCSLVEGRCIRWFFLFLFYVTEWCSADTADMYVVLIIHFIRF